MEGKTDLTQTLLECMAARISKHFKQLTKHYRTKKNIKPGDLVIVSTEKTTKNKWPLGIIQEVHAGRDGLVRSALIKMPLSSEKIDAHGRTKAAPKIIRRGIETLASIEEQVSELLP